MKTQFKAIITISQETIKKMEEDCSEATGGNVTVREMIEWTIEESLKAKFNIPIGSVLVTICK